MKKLISALAVLAFSQMTFAEPQTAIGLSAPALEKSYNCTVLILADDLKEYAEFPFVVGGASQEGSHGGEPKVFTAENHTVTVLANGRWLGISWSRGGELVSETLTARSDDNLGSQALIVYNPKNLNEQVDIVCDLILPETK
jgi:hypothetical protein